MRLSIYTAAVAAAALGVEAVANPPIRNIFTFPNNTFIENIAVRSNSKLLVTSMSIPHLFSIDPTVASPASSIIHTFANASGLSGIAEMTPDVFAVVTGVWDEAATRAALGSLAVWTVDFNKSPPAVKFITKIANSTIFNGVARHPYNHRILLAADSAAGSVWRVDIATGAHSIAFSSPLLTPTGTIPGTHLGINGLRSSGLHLYFTNSAQQFFGRVAVDWTGNKLGPITVISNSTEAAADAVVYDDIALDWDLFKPSAWIASHPSYAIQVFPDGTQRVVNDPELLLNPTSAAFGRGSLKEKKTLYVTNGGEFVIHENGFDLVNEGVVALDL